MWTAEFANVTAAIAGAIAAGSVLAAGRLARHRYSARELLPSDGVPDFADPPLVSVLIPARNEEEVIEACVSSVLAQQYPSFEVIVCDDDSTDATPTILQRLADRDPRLRVIRRAGAPPPGWIGKNHALRAVSREARGGWFLCIDADCILGPGALAAAIHRAARPADGVARSLVSALPQVGCNNFASRLMMPVFGVWFSLAVPIHEVNDPKKRAAAAAGGFLLISREALGAIGGYERLAPHIIEDVLTAKLVKSSGRRIELFLARDSCSTEMYSGWKDLWEGIVKNAYAGVDFRPGLAVATVISILAFGAIPAAGAAAIGALWILGVSIPPALALAGGLFAFSACVLVLLHCAIARELRFPIGYGLLAPAGHLLYAAALFRSMTRGRYGKGVGWKGRNYYGLGEPVPSDRLMP